MAKLNYDHITSLADIQMLIAAKEKEIRHLRMKIAHSERRRRQMKEEEEEEQSKKKRKSSEEPNEVEEKERLKMEDGGKENSSSDKIVTQMAISIQSLLEKIDGELISKLVTTDELLEPCPKRQRISEITAVPQISPAASESSEDSPPPQDNYLPPALMIEIDGEPISELVKRPPPNVLMEMQDRECSNKLHAY